ncbi:PREDICTED: 28S ribosomal protein S23, mitochondrial isoform X1 [Haliaeetus leucocephalus]|uniref:28S ribosomal protein S23, mitochondrial isoform X1 n=1 Tax=Haliaeetus leucocephalus TaxID=52644 RepID=UPI00053CE0C0|nr:PREDICTED: 28S ribosomal protein S23, mitochondrial isoform X1 [Haliaeetus leucocephalus]
MAGNRMQKIGSVFSRTRNLLRIGVIKKPLWFDVYAAFPPLREPVYRVPRPRYGKVKDVIRPILYQEDEVRAKFYKVYGSGPRPFNLSQSNYKSTCQRFVEKFNELKEEGKIEEEKLFEETGKALLASGIILQRRGTDKGSWCSQVVSLRPGKPRPFAIVTLANDLEQSFRCLAILHPIMEQPYDLFWAKLLTSFLLQDECVGLWARLEMPEEMCCEGSDPFEHPRAGASYGGLSPPETSEPAWHGGCGLGSNA